jgi:hypothetical protein
MIYNTFKSPTQELGTTVVIAAPSFMGVQGNIVNIEGLSLKA